MLDNYVVEQRNPEHQPPGRPYWDDEVRQARQLASEWAGALFVLDPSGIVAWVRTGFLVAEHIETLRAAGIHPSDLEWNYEDRGEYNLGTKLSLGHWTVDMVITEVERRRALD